MGATLTFDEWKHFPFEVRILRNLIWCKLSSNQVYINDVVETFAERERLSKGERYRYDELKASQTRTGANLKRLRAVVGESKSLQP